MWNPHNTWLGSFIVEAMSSSSLWVVLLITGLCLEGLYYFITSLWHQPKCQNVHVVTRKYSLRGQHRYYGCKKIINHCQVITRNCPACRTSLIATRFWVVMICPIIKCLTVVELSFILFDLCLFITIFNFILNYVPIVTFWILTYHKIWILLIIFCFIWSYWIIYFLTCLEVFWSVVS